MSCEARHISQNSLGGEAVYAVLFVLFSAALQTGWLLVKTFWFAIKFAAKASVTVCCIALITLVTLQFVCFAWPALLVCSAVQCWYGINFLYWLWQKAIELLVCLGVQLRHGVNFLCWVLVKTIQYALITIFLAACAPFVAVGITLLTVQNICFAWPVYIVLIPAAYQEVCLLIFSAWLTLKAKAQKAPKCFLTGCIAVYSAWLSTKILILKILLWPKSLARSVWRVYKHFCNWWNATEQIQQPSLVTERNFLPSIGFKLAMANKEVARLQVVKDFVVHFSLSAVMMLCVIVGIEQVKGCLKEFGFQVSGIAGILLIYYALIAIPVFIYCKSQKRNFVEIYLATIRPNAFFFIYMFGSSTGLLLPVESVFSNIVTLFVLICCSPDHRLRHILGVIITTPFIMCPIVLAVAMLGFGFTPPEWMRDTLKFTAAFCTPGAFLVIAVSLQQALQAIIDDVFKYLRKYFLPALFVVGMGLFISPIFVRLIAKTFLAYGLIYPELVDPMTMLMAMACSTSAFLVIQQFCKIDADDYFNCGSWSTGASYFTVPAIKKLFGIAA